MSTQTESPSIALDYVKTIGIVNNGFNGRGFANPYDIVVDGGGRIFVVNRCDPLRASAIRVGVCTLDEEYLNEFGRGNGAGDGQFVWVVAMALRRNPSWTTRPKRYVPGRTGWKRARSPSSSSRPCGGPASRYQ